MEPKAQPVKPATACAVVNPQRFVNFLEDNLWDLDGLAVLFGQCAYQVDECDFDKAKLAQLLYLGESCAKRLKSAIICAVDNKLSELRIHQTATNDIINGSGLVNNNRVPEIYDQVSDDFDDCFLLSVALEELANKSTDNEAIGHLIKTLREKLHSFVVSYMQKKDSFVVTNLEAK